MVEFISPISVGSYNPSGEDEASFHDIVAHQIYSDSPIPTRYGALSRSLNVPAEEGFSPYEGGRIKGYEQYADAFEWVQNEEQLAYQIKELDDKSEARRELAESDRWFAKMAAGLIDPTNIILAFTVPMSIGPTVVGSIVRAGAYNAFAEVIPEVGRRTYDPTRTNMDSIAYVGGAALFGGGLGGILSGVTKLKQRVVIQRQVNQLANTALGQVSAAQLGNVPNRNFSSVVLNRLGISGGLGNISVQYRRLGDGQTLRFVQTDEIHSLIEGALKSSTNSIDANSTLGIALKAASRNNDYTDAVKIVIDNLKPASKNVTLEDAFKTTGKFKGFLPKELLEILQRTVNSEIPDRPLMLVDIEKLDAEFKSGNLTVGNVPIKNLNIDVKNIEDALEIKQHYALAARSLGIPSSEMWRAGKSNKFSTQELLAKSKEALDDAVFNYNTNRVDIGEKTVKQNIHQRNQKANGKSLELLKQTSGASADLIEKAIVNTPAAKVWRFGLNGARDLMDMLIGDGTNLTKATMDGRAPHKSIRSMIQLEQAQLQPILDELDRLWQLYMDKTPTRTFGMSLRSVTDIKGSKRDFMMLATKSLMHGQGHPDPNIHAAAGVMDVYFKKQKIELQSMGAFNFQDRPALESRRGHLNFEIKTLREKEKADFYAKGGTTGFRESKELNILYKKLEDIEYDLDSLNSFGPIKNMDESYMNRQYNIGEITKHRDFFTDLLRDRYMSEGIYRSEATLKAKGVVANILSERVNALPQLSRLKYMKERTVPFSNRELIDVTLPGGEKIDFISTDGDAIMRRYSATMGAWKGYSALFNQKSWKYPDENFDDAVRASLGEMKNAGKPQKELDIVNQSLYFERDSVLFRLPIDPTRWDNRLTQNLKAAVYPMTMALNAFSSLPEYGMFVLGAGFGNAFRVVSKGMDRDLSFFKVQSFNDLQRAAGTLELTDGALTQILNENPEMLTNPNNFAMFREKLVDSFFGLTGSKTVVVGQRLLNSRFTIDAVMRSIANSNNINVGARSVSQKNMRQYDDLVKTLGLTRTEQKMIARELEKNGAKMYDKKSDMFLASTDNWDANLAASFNIKLRNRIDALVIMANAPDQYKILRGVIHVRDTPFNRKVVEGLFTPKKQKQMHKDVLEEIDELNKLSNPDPDRLNGLREELKIIESNMRAKTHGDYLVIHSGLFSIPFLLSSWSLAATKKVLTSQLRNEFSAPIAGGFSMFALAYAAEEMKSAIRSAGTTRKRFSDKTILEKSVFAMTRTGYFGIMFDYYQRLATSQESITGIQAVPDVLKFGEPLHPAMEIPAQVGGVSVGLAMDTMNLAYEGEYGRALRKVTPLGQLPFWGGMVQSLGQLAEKGD